MKSVFLLLSFIFIAIVSFGQKVTVEELQQALEVACSSTTESNNLAQKLEEILILYQQNNLTDTRLKVKILSALGKAKLNEGDFPQYLVYLDATESLIHKADLEAERKVFYFEKGEVFMNRQKWQTAFDAYEKAIEYAQLDDDTLIIGKSLGGIALCCYGLGQNETALQNYQESVELLNSHGEIASWKLRYERDEKEKEIIALNERDSKVHEQRSLLLLSALTFGFILLFVHLKSKATIAQKEATYQAQEKIILSEWKRKATEETRLKEQLENKNRDITNLSLDIIRKNNFSEEIKVKLNELEKVLPENLKQKLKLRDLQLFTNSHLQLNDDLATLQINVDQVNQLFYEKLDALGKELSQTEKQLCGLILLNLSNKEISVIRKISANSAKVARYRLRKKLNLASDEDIVTFLQNI